MIDRAKWLFDLNGNSEGEPVDGLVPVEGYRHDQRPPEETAIMEKAQAYGAHAVFFEASRHGKPAVAQAFIFVSDGPDDDHLFAELHKRLWSWGGVPLLYRKTRGLIQLFRCAHKPDFISPKGEVVCSPFRVLDTAAKISDDPWWDASRLRNGTIWDDPSACKAMLSASKAAHKQLIDAVRELNTQLNEEAVLRKHLRRKLLILSLLIAYLEERNVLLPDYFGEFQRGATRFFEILANGEALVRLLADLEDRFNGNVFALDDADRELLRGSNQLVRFASLVEGRKELNGQLTLWQLYSFKDLPVELISHIYQIFLTDSDSSVYTPPFLVRLMLDEALSWARIDRLHQNNEVILDPACGSGIFLVEAYKRLVLHWRSRNDWKMPGKAVLKGLLSKVHGIDVEQGAVELAAFSLYLALCDALEPEAIRSSIRLFPQLAGKTLHNSCFFDAKSKGLVRESVGAIVGNPPFESKLTTPGAENSYECYQTKHGLLPDKQLAYLFLHEAMQMIAEGGVLSMLQQYSFLYNQHSLEFRRRFMKQWDVREILDFISVRGLFQKGDADTKVIVVVAEAVSPSVDRRILHATFRRSGRVDAEQGFDIDYYDLHWLPRQVALKNDRIWRTDLLGGGRVLALADRLKEMRTLKEYAQHQGWDCGEGFIEGKKGKRVAAKHITGKNFVPSVALSNGSLDRTKITKVKATHFKSAYTKKRFTPPMLLIREHMSIPHCLWTETYLTYTQQIVGFCGRKEDTQKLNELSIWLSKSRAALQAQIALTSPGLFIQKATSIQADDIFSMPYPENGVLDLSANEQILVDDIVDYYCELIRLGTGSVAMKANGFAALADFTDVFTRQINAVYKKNTLQALEPHVWPGVICQPFVFGNAKVDWSGADALKDKVDALLHDKTGETLRVTRIAYIHDSNFIFLLKPDQLRYWLRSVALRDADETLSDLRRQGF
jgi:hypothetical protein